MATKKERLQKKRAATTERKMEAEFEKKLNEAYQEYKDLFYSKIEKKSGMLSKEDFRRQFAGDVEQLLNMGKTRKEIYKENLGEVIFELNTQAFSRYELDYLTAAIDRARKEITDRTFAGDGDPEMIANFMVSTENIDKEYIREHFGAIYGMMRDLFGSKEEFEEWVSPTVEPTEI